MNDRFKFRVWDGDEYVETIMDDCYIQYDGKLICGAYFDDGYVGRYDNYADSEVIIEQCTGLKDKNGELIYEGDIVKQGSNIYKVVFSYDDVASCVCCVDSFSGCGFVMEDKWTYRGDLDKYAELEVIGNIHENAELLK